MTEDILSRLPLNLGDGLALRLAGEEDAERLVEFHTRMHDESVGEWVRDLTCGRHPTVGVGDFVLVEDRSAGRIVSTVCLISQTWTYGGIPFPMGRSELVLTDPEYRRRGLVRRQFEVIHALSAARGELMLGITGIPWFYRQFGYEMAMSLGGGRTVLAFRFPGLEKGERCLLRPAAAADRPFIRELHDQVSRRNLFAGQRSDREWAWIFAGCSRKSFPYSPWSVVEDDGRVIGFVNHCPGPSQGRFVVHQLELIREANRLHVMYRLLRHLRAYGESLAPEGGEKTVDELYLGLGGDHPLYEVLGSPAIEEKPYAWYIRVPNLIAFLNRVRPALERNLKGTIAEGCSTEEWLSFYRSGLKIVIDRGQITAIQTWAPVQGEHTARFPDLTFLQLLCGRRRLAELEAAFPDCTADHHTRVLLDCLFPPFSGQL